MQQPTRPAPGVIIWTALAALAVGLFAAMSLLALPPGAAQPAPADLSPSPSATEFVAADNPTPDLSAAATGEELPGTPTASAPTPTPTTGPAGAPDPTALIGLWLSAVSAITALIGLASSLWLGWRKEARDIAQHRLELEKARLEIRKLEHELAAKGGSEGSTSEAGA